MLEPTSFSLVSYRESKLPYRTDFMNDSRLVKISKYLSKHLRHTPERLGLTLAPGGWVTVDELLAACAASRFSITRSELKVFTPNLNDDYLFLFRAGRTLRLFFQLFIPRVDIRRTLVGNQRALFSSAKVCWYSSCRSDSTSNNAQRRCLNGKRAIASLTL